jgi:hypothetical protein
MTLPLIRALFAALLAFAACALITWHLHSRP